MTLSEYKKFSPLFDKDITVAVSPKSAIARRNVIGGCAKYELVRPIAVIKAALESI